MAEQKEEKPSFRVRYFGAPGRAAPIRLALAIGGFAFEDEFVTRDEHIAAKKAGQRRWGGLPEVTLYDKDGKEVQTIGQSIAQLRFIGRLSGLYGDTVLEGALMDEVIDALGDANASLSYNGETDKEKQKALRLALIAEDGAMTGYLKKFELRLEENEKRGNKNGFFVGDKLSIADLAVLGSLSAWVSGFYDHIPKDLYTKNHPRLAKFLELVGGQEKVKEFNGNFMQRMKDFGDDAKKDAAKCVKYPGKQADLNAK